MSFPVVSCFGVILQLRVGPTKDGSVAEWLACWTLAQKGPGSNRSRDAVGTPVVPLFTKQQSW